MVLDIISTKLTILRNLDTQINQVLKSRIPLRLKKGCLKIAIDLNLICYYGKATSLAFISQAIERKYRVVENIYIPSG